MDRHREAVLALADLLPDLDGVPDADERRAGRAHMLKHRDRNDRRDRHCLRRLFGGVFEVRQMDPAKPSDLCVP